MVAFTGLVLTLKDAPLPVAELVQLVAVAAEPAKNGFSTRLADAVCTNDSHNIAAIKIDFKIFIMKVILFMMFTFDYLFFTIIQFQRILVKLNSNRRIHAFCAILSAIKILIV